MQQKIVITGSSGMLGQDVVKALADTKKYQIFGVDKLPIQSNDSILEQRLFDISDLSLLKSTIEQIKPDIIIHLAAIVNLKVCEDNFSVARSLHIDVSRFLARQNAKIIYISTDSVFNGETGNYTEESIPDPINNYGMTKYLGELAVRANNKNSLVIRTNIFGYNNPLKFSLAEWALDALKNGVQISGYKNVIFNAIYTKHLANIIVDLIVKDHNGLINIASKTQMSKYDFLVALANATGLHNAKITSTLMEVEAKSSIKRPLNTTLCIERTQRFVNLPTMESGIADLVVDYKREYFDERN